MTQAMFIEPEMNSSTFSIDSWTTDRKTVKTSQEIQLNIGFSSSTFSPKYFNLALKQMPEQEQQAKQIILQFLIM